MPDRLRILVSRTSDVSMIFKPCSLGILEGTSTISCRQEELSVPVAVDQTIVARTPTTESNRSRSKTVSSATVPEVESLNRHSSQGSSSTGFNLLQSIKDLTYQELYRANPLGLLGKEVISVSGTTHCPEPIPPNEKIDETPSRSNTSISSSPSKLSPISEHEPQKLQFPLNSETADTMHRRSMACTVLPPCPAEFIPDGHDDTSKPYLFSQPCTDTLIADFIPDTMTINVFEVFIYAWGVFAFFFDMVTDLVLAHAYYIEGAYWLFLLTLMCVLVPNLTLSIFSLVWYIDGSQLKAAAAQQDSSDTQFHSSKSETKVSDDTPGKDRTENHGPISDIRQRSSNHQSGSELAPLQQQRTSLSPTDADDQPDTHVSRLRERPATPEQTTVKGKRLQFSAATANVLTWIIRIIILVLQLDLCLK